VNERVELYGSGAPRKWALRTPVPVAAGGWRRSWLRSCWLGSARGRSAATCAFADCGIGIGDDVRGATTPRPLGVRIPDVEGVSASEARSGSSSDFFLCLSDRCGGLGTGAAAADEGGAADDDEDGGGGGGARAGGGRAGD
jgi:hypothetical protein